jgi:hypothetical protein
MENNEEYKGVVASIKVLEQQLLQVDDKQLEQQANEVARNIKEYFAQCVNALAERQEALLSELRETSSKQSE